MLLEAGFKPYSVGTAYVDNSSLKQVINAATITSDASAAVVVSYEGQTGTFAVDDVVIDSVTGATGTVSSVTDYGPTGVLELTGITGTFQNNSIIYKATLGNELITNGNFTNWTTDDPDDWTIVSESGSDPMVTEVSGACRMYTSGAYIMMWQNPLTLDNLYEAKLTIDAAVEGGLNYTKWQ